MADKFDPIAWVKDLGSSIVSGGEVKKALDETANALNNLKKSGDPAAYFHGLEKIAKSAVPNEKKKAKPDAQKDLEELRKAAEMERKTAEQLLFSAGTEKKGMPA